MITSKLLLSGSAGATGLSSALLVDAAAALTGGANTPYVTTELLVAVLFGIVAFMSKSGYDQIQNKINGSVAADSSRGEALARLEATVTAHRESTAEHFGLVRADIRELQAGLDALPEQIADRMCAPRHGEKF